MLTEKRQNILLSAFFIYLFAAIRKDGAARYKVLKFTSNTDSQIYL